MPTSSFSVTASSGFRPNASNRARCQTRSFLRQAGPRTIFLPYSSRPLPRFGMLPWDIDITVGSTPRAPHRRDCLSAGRDFAECGGVCLERLAGRLHRPLGSRRLLFRERRPRRCAVQVGLQGSRCRTSPQRLRRSPLAGDPRELRWRCYCSISAIVCVLR